MRLHFLGLRTVGWVGVCFERLFTNFPRCYELGFVVHVKKIEGAIFGGWSDASTLFYDNYAHYGWSHRGWLGQISLQILWHL